MLSWIWKTLEIVALIGGVIGTFLYAYDYGYKEGKQAGVQTKTNEEQSPCQMRISSMKIANLMNSLANMKVRPISIVVENGRKNTCPYAMDLREIFTQAQWNPGPIQESGKLLGNSLWFISPDQDHDAVEFYEAIQLNSRQEAHYSDDEKLKEPKWFFYIKDQWTSREPED